jgi:hypothetical protein
VFIFGINVEVLLCALKKYFMLGSLIMINNFVTNLVIQIVKNKKFGRPAHQPANKQGGLKWEWV